MNSCFEGSLSCIRLLFRHVKYAREFACKIVVVREHLRLGVPKCRWARTLRSDHFSGTV